MGCTVCGNDPRDLCLAEGANIGRGTGFESEDMPLAYLPGNSVRVRVVGGVAAN
jgi:hypothetical protein